MLSYANEVFFKSISVKMQKNPRLGKNSISFYFIHTRFVEKTDCKLSVSNGSAHALTTYKLETSSYSWASEGGTGGPCLPGFWKLTFFYYIFSKTRSFYLFSEGQISPLLSPPWKDLYGYFWKNPLKASPRVKILPTPMFPNYGRLFLYQLNDIKFTAE